jgi:hypothetical protein
MRVSRVTACSPAIFAVVRFCDLSHQNKGGGRKAAGAGDPAADAGPAIPPWQAAWGG